MRVRLLAVLAAVVSTALGAAPPATAAPGTALVCRLHDRRIDEASGIARGVRSPGMFYVQNDSGDRARFFAVDARTCATAATVDVTGAHNVDWEDLAVAPDPAGTPSVWLGDIGDNDARRPEVDIYRVDEPAVAAGGSDAQLMVRAVDEWRLRYPTGPVNAESLAVTPSGVAYVITKSLLGASTVYRVPAAPSRTRVQELQPVGTIDFGFTGTRNPFGAAGELTATGAAISPDGSLLAVRTYSDAYLWRVRDGGVAAAIATAPTRVALPQQPQGEGIGFDGPRAGRLVVDSEGIGTAIYRLPVPAVRGAASPTATSRPASPALRPSRTAASAPSRTSSAHPSGGLPLILVVVLVVALVIVLAGAARAAQRTHRRRGR